MRAELIGTDICSAAGITVHEHAPVLALCRKLMAAGHDAVTPLLCYRGDILALNIRSIGEAAQLEVNGTATGFVRYRARKFEVQSTMR